MLKKKYRLKTKERPKTEYSFVTPFYLLKVRKTENLASRFAFIVSKKIDKRATVRNRIKRQMRHCIEEILEDIKPGLDMLFVMKKNSMNKKTQELCQDLKMELKKRDFLYD